MPLGILVADAAGQVFFRNQFAMLEQFDGQESVLLDNKVRDLIATALDGGSGEEMADFWGPPRRTFELRSLPVIVDGESAGATVVIEDVTERSRLNQVRRDFVANMSHELRTPVGAISVLAETLLTNNDPDVVARLSERLHRESFRLGNTIEDLLALSRLESGEDDQFDEVLVADIFADAKERAAQASVGHSIELTTEQAELGLTIYGDRSQLSAAVGNLVDNAAKYSEPGSRIELAARALGDSVELSVTDHGVGIPEGELERIFERFYRVDPARSRQTGGTGLGLSIVRHVVRNHRGDIHVESREGEGSTFTLRFPQG
ncbi:MAG: ATP-binding protein [Acidimicrobiales bacterium]